MIITFKSPIKTGSGVTYPAGYQVDCDVLINLPNGFTQLAVLSQPRSGLIVADEVMTLAARDIYKLDITLQHPV